MGLSYDALFPGRFIKAGEMGDKPATLTIATVYLDHLEGEDGREKPQAVVSFSETKREWALNKTNAQCLVAMWGPQSDDWLGKRVTLVAERDPSGLSDSGVCLRVKGSPDIAKPIKAQIKLPRRRPQERVLVPTGNGNGSKPHKVDDTTGEVYDFNDEPRHGVEDDAEPPGMGYDEYVASRADEEAPADNVLPLHDAGAPVTAQQMAEIKKLRKGLNASEFSAMVAKFGDPEANDYGLTVETAGFFIEELKGLQS